MPDQFKFAPKTTVQFLGELHPLADILSSPDGLSSMAPAAAYLQIQQVKTAQGLLSFLENYRAKVLFKLELPSIARAYWHVSRSEVRELINLDQQLLHEASLEAFADVSRLIGSLQLKRFRPLKDNRVVQRYLRVVEAGEAHAWHTLVYGLILSVYSLPLRQGLMEYATHTFDGFVRSASGSLLFSEPEFRDVLQEITSELPAAVDAIVERCAPFELPKS